MSPKEDDLAPDPGPSLGVYAMRALSAAALVMILVASVGAWRGELGSGSFLIL